MKLPCSHALNNSSHDQDLTRGMIIGLMVNRGHELYLKHAPAFNCACFVCIVLHDVHTFITVNDKLPANMFRSWVILVHVWLGSSSRFTSPLQTFKGLLE